MQWKSRGKKKKNKDEERTDLYGLLGLTHERWTATDNQIKNGTLSTTGHLFLFHVFYSANKGEC